MRRLIAWLALALGCAGVCATEAPSLASDVALEARVLELAQELRCLVCQNETIAASQADLAIDLRQQIRGKLREGQSPQQIRDFMVERYGDFILYRPRFGARTLLLWVGPFVLLLLGLAVLWRTIRRRAVEPSDELARLGPDDARRARELLGMTQESRP